MNYIKRFMCFLVLAAISMAAMTINARNIDASAARNAASKFIRQQAVPGMFKATSPADLTLSHAEPSSAVTGANDYYVFNIKGGGFIIISGEDRGAQVLGYSDKGRFVSNNLPAPLVDLLNGYKQEIEFLQNYKEDDLVPMQNTFQANRGVEPLIKTTWGQEMPYYLQCPTENGEYCVVGCVATAMAQVMYYWQFPTSSQAISGYGGGWWGGMSVPALPATTFDYSLMLLSYCHWDWDNSVLVQDTYTDAQAQEVAKLGRYCGQAVEMDYSPEGSGAYTSDQLDAMKNFGYSQSAQYVQKSGWYSSSYTTAQWEAMIKTELDAGRPILYAANDPNAGGHAFICDGYNSDNKYHFNFGWYGTCDGWYVSTALNMTHRDGDQLKFNSGHEMLIGVEPPAYCILTAESINPASGLLVLGNPMDAEALNVNLRTSYSNVNVLFGLTDESGNNVCNGNAITINKNTFVAGSAIDGSITLPEMMEDGSYNVNLYYYTSNASDLQTVATATGKLQVVGHLAKYDEPFNISDVTAAISYVLKGTYPNLDISDVTHLISHVLSH